MKAAERAHLLRLAVLVAIALIGLAGARLFGWSGVEHSLPYVLVASALLCFGLYMAVYGIDKFEARLHWRIVLIAVTVGVLCKYLIIFLAAYMATSNWEYAVLGMSVAQIDPLSVAALQGDPRMNPRTKTVLNMWASFDDPMTALATPFILGLSASFANQAFADGTKWTDALIDLAPFALALLVVGLVALRRRMHDMRGTRGLMHKLDDSEKAKGTVASVVGAISAPLRLYSIAALIGWFVRPEWLGKGRRAELLTNTALYGATFLLGILLAGGVDWKGGLVLGAATYASQIIVAWLVMWSASRMGKEGSATRSFSARDTWHLALAQQNGITAIVLALNLEPFIDGAVAAVSLAIVVANLLNFACNWAFDRLEARRA
ncbi:MAG TPA: hypothetical protein VFT16_04395 [Candidatus Saccharimonadales bacterium]|nr:hypothetical protein [Candidatus Saccharimonadales bacterium]